MMCNPEISVVMSVYQESKEFLTSAVESILNQTYKNFEFLIVIDSPNYKYKNILVGYSEADKRVKLIYNKKNIGLTKSLNKAIKIVKGKYVARQDADDISLPQRLEKQYNFIKNNPMYSIVGTNICFIDSNGRFIRRIKLPINLKRVNRIMFKRNLLVHGTVLMKKECLIDVGSYNENIVYAQDYELWLRCIRNNKKIHIINCELYCLRRHQESVSSKNAFYQSTMHFLIQKEIDFEEFNSKNIEKYLSIFNEKEKSYVYYMSSKLILRSNMSISLGYCKESIKYYKYNINTYLLFCYIMINMLLRKT